ncbi:MAG: hypothetical protein ACXWC6_12150 [Ramlibacter sp.]
MKRKATLFLPIAATIVLGLVQDYAVVACFAWISSHTPVPR